MTSCMVFFTIVAQIRFTTEVMFMSDALPNKNRTLAKLRQKMSELEQSSTDISQLTDNPNTEFLSEKTLSVQSQDDTDLNSECLNTGFTEQEQNKQEIYKQLRHKITRFLSKREHSVAELVQKLSLQEFAEPDIHHVLDKFVQNGIQSDTRFTFHFVRNCMMKGQGLSRVKQALKAHDIDSAMLHQALEELDVDWYAKAYEVKCKKFGDEVEKDWSKKQKQMRFLQYRGFSQDQISFAISENANEDLNN